MKKVIYALLIVILATSLILGFQKYRPADATGQTTLSYAGIFNGDEDQPQPENSTPIEGCGREFAVIIEDAEPVTGTATLEKALNKLFSIKEMNFVNTPFTNSLYNSDLSASVTETDSGIEVDLSGQVISAGTCDDPRIRAQIEGTIRNYAKGKSFTVTLNGEESAWRCLGDESGMCE